MFKALISAGLNRGRLAQWIRLVIRMPELAEKHYERWSYVVRSGKYFLFEQDSDFKTTTVDR